MSGCDEHKNIASKERIMRQKAKTRIIGRDRERKPLLNNLDSLKIMEQFKESLLFQKY